MTSPLPPRRRDTTTLADLLRQDRTNLRQLDPGLMGGRFSPAKPPEPFLEDDEEGDDEDGNLDLVRFLNTDRVILATDGGTPVIPLTYIPEDGSEQVFWAGDALARHEWSRTDTALTIPAQAYYKANEEFWVDYAYYGEPSDLAPEPPGPATATLRAGRTAFGEPSGGQSLSSLALPAGTVVGDLIIVTTGGVVAVSDARLTPIGSCMWIGWASDLSNVAATAAAGNFWSIACITLATNATGWTSAVTSSVTGLSDTNTFPVPTVGGVAAAVCAIYDTHSVVHGNCSTPSGYTLGIGANNDLAHARVDFWTAAELGTSPTGPSTFAGGPGAASVTVVGLIGP